VSLDGAERDEQLGGDLGVRPAMINCPPRDLTGCLARFTGLGYRQLVSYQPASRFWTIQCGETAIYLLLAVGLAGLCGWWLRQRLS
jgi:hypothetical protein